MRPQENLPILWNQSSFVFIPGDLTGFSQSHYFQQKQSVFSQMKLDSVSRALRFDSIISRLQVRTGIYPYLFRSGIDIMLNLFNFMFSMLKPCSLGRIGPYKADWEDLVVAQFVFILQENSSNSHTMMLAIAKEQLISWTPFQMVALL